MRYLRFFLQAYAEGKPQADGTLHLIDVVSIDLIASTEKEAVSRAAGLIKRKNYRVYNVAEFDSDLEKK